MRILSRTVTVTEEGLEYEADQRHTETLGTWVSMMEAREW